MFRAKPSKLTRLLSRPLAVLPLLLLAFALRIWGLADHNIWWDEGVSIWVARLPVDRLIDWTAHDTHPPLYFLLLKGWRWLVGEGEFVLRFSSVLAGTAGVALIYGLGCIFRDRRAAWLAAFLLTLSGFAISWSQEIRMYIWAASLATASLWAALHWWRTGSWRAWVAYVLLMVISLWTLYLLSLLLVVVNLGFIVFWWGRGRPWSLFARWVAAQLAALVLFAPWLIYALTRMKSWSIAEPFTADFLVQLYATLLAVGISTHLERYLPGTLAVFALFAVALVALWRDQRTSEQRAEVALLLLGLSLPVGAIYFLALPIDRPFYVPPIAPRYLLPLATCFYALMGLGLAALARWRRWSATLGLCLVSAVAVGGLLDFYPGRWRHDDLISLAATLQAYVQPGDAVVLHSDHDWPLFAAQYAGDWQGVPNGASVDTTTAQALLSPLWAQAEGVWLVTTPDAQRIDPQFVIRDWLETHSRASWQQDFGENSLTFYARTPERAATARRLGPQAVLPQTHPRDLGGAKLLGSTIPLSKYKTGDTLWLALWWGLPLPTTSLTVTCNGPVSQTLTVSAPIPAPGDPTRQLVAVPLSPGLPTGHYEVLVSTGQGVSVVVGQFYLQSQMPPGAVATGDIPHPLSVRLGEHIRLLGYTLAGTTFQPGDILELTLYWSTDAVLDSRYKVFTQIVGQEWNAANNNFLWGQQDNEPQGGLAPTTIWAPGVIITDDYTIPLAEDAPAGIYTLQVGLYGLVDGARLPVFDDKTQWIGDAVRLSEIVVRP